MARVTRKSCEVRSASQRFTHGPWHFISMKQNMVKVVCVIYDTVFISFLLYYTTQTERFAAKLCNVIIRNYIQFSKIRTTVMSLYN